MTKIVAISKWKHRVSPVMDSARQLMIIEYDNKTEVQNSVVDIPNFSVIHKAEFLKSHGVNILICGAISRHMQQVITASDIEVIPFIRGSIRKVLDAYLNDDLISDDFFLPGCQRHGNASRQRRCRQQRRQR